MSLSPLEYQLLELLRAAPHETLERKEIPPHLMPFVPALDEARLVAGMAFDVMLLARGRAELARRTEADREQAAEADKGKAKGAGQPEAGEARKPQRPCYDRDHTWLRWAEEEGMTPARIRDRWNKEHPTEKVSNGDAGRDTVKKGLSRAASEQHSD
jgi:hypothetical protein